MLTARTQPSAAAQASASSSCCGSLRPVTARCGRPRSAGGLLSTTATNTIASLHYRPATVRVASSLVPGDPSTEILDPSVLEAARDPAISQLAQQVLEAEAELRVMFEPGRPMPAASIVAKKRQQICDMKLLLAAKLNGQQTPVDPDASDDEAERARKLFMQVEQSLQRQQRPAKQRDSEYSFELSLLEAENDRLREKAEALLKRQALLEDIAQKAGLLIARDGKLYWTKGQKTGALARSAPPASASSNAPAKAPAASSGSGVMDMAALQDRLEMAAMSVAGAGR